MSQKYSLVVEVKYNDDSKNPNREVCQGSNKQELEDVAVRIAQHKDYPRVVPFKSELNGTDVSGVLGVTRNAYVVNSDQIDEL